MIEYHFVPDVATKESLMENSTIAENKIFVTGIPIHESFDSNPQHKKTKDTFNVIISGGSLGLGNLNELLNQHTKKESKLHFYILCGNNTKLFQKIKNMNAGHIQPLAYITSREEMNDLYSRADAIITKPGGVTISESLKKDLPIFVFSALPGQEEINLQLLSKKGLVYKINSESTLEQQVIDTLSSEIKMKAYRMAVQQYLQSLDLGRTYELFCLIHSFVKEAKNKNDRSIHVRWKGI